MNGDEGGFFDSLTEQVLGAVFEISNTLVIELNVRTASRTNTRHRALTICELPVGSFVF